MKSIIVSIDKSGKLNKKNINNIAIVESLKTWRSVEVLSGNYTQLLLILFSPVLIFDAWIHKIFYRFTSFRVYVCDRYYDDLVLNYTNPHIRRVVKFLIPSSKYKYYLYAMPEEHFNRKNDEDIEMIAHMQNCYNQYGKYAARLPTNIDKVFLYKKITTMTLKLL